jgi:hypothetical protein
MYYNNVGGNSMAEKNKLDKIIELLKEISNKLVPNIITQDDYMINVVCPFCGSTQYGVDENSTAPIKKCSGCGNTY